MTSERLGNKERLRLANTMSREVEEFIPMSEKEVGLYTCGPTVYQRAHIGNLRAYIHADTVKRVLEFSGYKVKHVMNITDVGHLTSDADEGADKLQESAKRERTTAWEISKKYMALFLDDIQRINIILPNIICRATDHIPEQIELIKRLEARGYIYTTKDGVYFDTSKLEDYGKLARLDIKGLSAGKRIEMGEKRNKTDFALWKFSRPGEKRDMEWVSPWGVGFPGWHIECSAMSIKYLGEQFDVHTGGVDHIPIHHTNEIAQSESATGKKPFVRYWLHSEFLLTQSGEKMSKSLGDIVDLDTLEELRVEPLAFRYFCLNANYGSKLQLGEKSLKGAQKGYETLKAAVVSLARNATETDGVVLGEIGNQYLRDFRAVVAENLNTPKALAILRAMLKDARLPERERYYLALRFDEVFGLGFSGLKQTDEGQIPEEVMALIEEREKYRTNRDWGKADSLRKEISQMGYDLLDTPTRTIIKKIAK